MIRFLAFVTALILVAAAAHGTISSTGGYGTPQAYATIAVAIGVVVGSAVIGYVRGVIAGIALFVMLCAGEGYALLSTANRVVAASDAAQAPLIDAKQRHEAAVKALADAEAEKPAPASRERLTAAETAKATADKAVREQASLMGCKKNCADLLQAAADKAAREVEAARAELANHDQIEAQRLAAKVEQAKAALKAAPLPPSATPFADRIGVAPWIVELASAGMLSLGLNGLAAFLIWFAAHPQKETEPQPAEQSRAEPTIQPKPARPREIRTAPVAQLPPPRQPMSVIDFGADKLIAAPGDSLDFDEFFEAYVAAAERSKMRAHDAADIVAPFKELCTEAGIRVRKRGAKLFLCDVRLAS